jgi:nucleoside-diphosphate-sugar epimerase
MRILVTGSAGFIGSHLAERLAREGHQVRGMDCLTDYYSPELKEINQAAVEKAGAEVFQSNLARDDLEHAVRDAEVVYHLAAQPGISDSTPFEEYVRNNIKGTYRLLEAVRTQPALKMFANISTSSVYGAHATDPEDAPPKPTSYYGVTKLAAEQLVLAYHRDKGLPACSLRLFSVYGERERPEKLYPKLIRSILENREFPVYEGSEQHRRSYTYVGDIVEGLLSALNHLDTVNGEIFNIGSDTQITTGEGIRIVEEILGRPARKVYRPRRSGDQLNTHANIEKARRVLGYDPKTRPREGLQAEVEWMKNLISGKSAQS